MATPERDKEGFILVERKKQKKRKAEHSPLLHTPPGSSSASSSRSPTRPKPSSFNFPNQVPIIFRDADEKFKSVKQVMSELSQYHPELRVSRVKDLPNRSFLVVGNTPRDVVILQSDNKMKACLGQNLKISLPKAYQNQTKSKTLVVKGVPTEFTDEEFKQVLDHNKINHAKAERMKSKRDGRKLQMFQIDLSDSAEAEALISSNITCPQTGIIFKVEEFRTPISVQQCYNCQHFGHSAKNCQAKTKCVICGEGHSHKGCPNRAKKQPKCANCKGPHVANYKGCPAYKKQVFRQHVVDNQKSYASILKQNSAPTPQPRGDTFSFTADQLVKFVATVAIHIAQPQVCYATAPKDAVEKKSSLCRRVSEAAKSQLGVSISGSTLFEAIGNLRAPVLPASKIPVVRPEPFRFSAPNTKPPVILNSHSPPTFTNQTVPKQSNPPK